MVVQVTIATIATIVTMATTASFDSIQASIFIAIARRVVDLSSCL